MARSEGWSWALVTLRMFCNPSPQALNLQSPNTRYKAQTRFWV